MRALDWASTPLGPVAHWPQSLKTCVRIILTSRQPMFVWWGEQLINLYNDAYKSIVGGKHPLALGQPASQVWREIWDQVGPRAERAMRGNEGTYDEALLLIMERHGYQEETYYTFSYSPVPNEQGGTGGILCANTDDTRRIIGERRLALLRRLAAGTADARRIDGACSEAARALATNPKDLPFALIYLVGSEPEAAVLRGAAGISPGHPAAPARLDLGGASPWPLIEVLRSQTPQVVENLAALLPDLPLDPWARAPARAVAWPMSPSGGSGQAGVLVVGLNPFRLFDDDYRSFVSLVAGQIAASVANAQAYQEERRRAEALAALDRAKTAFFSNVSHEFRTPLTLILGPQEDALASPAGALGGESLKTVYRNTLRLLKLVNTLLDFSRIEAGRAQAAYQPTDLPALTRDLASGFQSAIERGGVRFEVDCPPLAEPVFVDREMWEKIVLNLLSNAFKFTLKGHIALTLRAGQGQVELAVADTGAGIPEHELPRVFERFHRIEGAQARTHEGSGIGLALVHELVELHGGRISVQSRLHEGSTFTVTVPLGRDHLPAERVTGAASGSPEPGAARAASFLAEAFRWPPEVVPEALPAPDPGHERAARLLVADDNPDMRDYLARLLRPRWQVDMACDGAEALALARQRRPDLILTDVMMPNLDGFGLLRAVRADPDIRHTAIIMLSARAGEESRVEGLDAGADDYLIKPFSAQELLARVRVHLEQVLTRQTIEQQATQLAEATRAKDEFLAMLGHELRNPLSPILTALQLMRLRGSETREQAVIERQVGHLVRLVDDLLDVSRITRGKIELRRERMELMAAVTSGLETARPLLEQRRQRLELDVAPEGLAIEGDPSRLAQVISNLLTNACKYSDPGSTVYLSAAREGDRIALTVRDEGVGMPPETLDRVFDLFYQQPQSLDRSKGGLGLGLAIVRSLVELHGGRVTARSDGPGRGAVFTVELPAAAPSTEVRNPPATGLLSPREDTFAVPEHARRVLIVDDNADAAEALSELLTDVGYEVRSANDAFTALKIAASFEPNYCLLDIGLPVMDGYELATRLRQSGPALAAARIVAVTGYGQDADRQRALQAGFDAHVVKPVSLPALIRAMSSAS